MSLLNTLIPARNGSQNANGAPAARRPLYEITENDAGYSLTVQLPGVSREGLEITDEGGELTIFGKRAAKLPEGVTALHRETSGAEFRLVVEHDNEVDPEKIGAELKDGVLQVTLAKAESAKPRKIAVA